MKARSPEFRCGIGTVLLTKIGQSRHVHLLAPICQDVRRALGRSTGLVVVHVPNETRVEAHEPLDLLVLGAVQEALPGLKALLADMHLRQKPLRLVPLIHRVLPAVQALKALDHCRHRQPAPLQVFAGRQRRALLLLRLQLLLQLPDARQEVLGEEVEDTGHFLVPGLPSNPPLKV